MRLLPAVLALLVAGPAFAQTPGDCAPGTASADLDISDVRATLLNNGNLFYGPGDGGFVQAAYVVPKNSGNTAIFAANLWVGGTVGGELRVAAATFLDFDMWPGPLDDGASLPDPNDCSDWDRIWVVSTLDVQAYDDTGVTTADLAEWPVELGAEVVDGDGVSGNYDLAGGDRPRIYGSQTAFWVMNDVGNEHVRSESEPIGLEMQATAFAISSPDAAFDQATFYRYRLVNRNTLPLEDARLSIWADTDMGDRIRDEYEGVDTTRGLGYYYNARETDSGYVIPPAAGFDFLGDGLGSFRYAINVAGSAPRGDPRLKVEIDRAQRGLWNDGVPMTAAGDGYDSDGPVTVWAFPGDPVANECWSDVNNCEGGANLWGNHRIIPTAPPFSLQPGEARTFDIAFLFAQGTSNLDSITELRAASDRVQAAYDDGSLFASVPPSIILAAPEPASPHEGALIVEQAPALTWSPVPGASGYTVRWSETPDFAQAYGTSTSETSTTIFGGLPTNHIADIFWQVRAEDGTGGFSPYSATRSFQFYRYEFDQFGNGTGIIEVANPEGEPCPDAGDPGCEQGYPGNTVWRDQNSTSAYVLANPGNDFGNLLRDGAVVDGDNFEIRFTGACATPGACLGVYSSRLPAGTNLITSVPFELWNVRGGLGTADDVRMIPMLRPLDGTEPAANWADTFPAEQEVIAGEDTLSLPVTHRVIGVMPDRPNGYALFEAAANSFGGVGATYDPESDGDEQVDPYPVEGGGDCQSQNFYADFCYRGNSNRLVAPIGGFEGLVLADFAGDGTTPPVGTVIRFDANERLLAVSAEADGPTQPASFALAPAYPNPFSSRATVPFEVAKPGRVRLSAFDVLGREVAVLVDGDLAAGEHRAVLDGSRLASGVYFVVLETGRVRQAKKVMLVR